MPPIGKKLTKVKSQRGNKRRIASDNFKTGRQAELDENKGKISVEGDVQNSNIIAGDKNLIGNTIIKNIQDNLNIYLFKDTRQIVYFVTVVFILLSGVIGGIWCSMQPKKMVGDFNIVIASFGEIVEGGDVKHSARAEKISSTLFNFLDSEYRASDLGLTVQTAHKNMPIIIEETEAERLSGKINADVIIYGNVYVQGDHAEFSPRFYVSEHEDTKELTGQNELAFPIPFKISELDSQDQINAELRTRTEILLSFTKALVYFSRNDVSAAESALQKAIVASEKTPQPFVGKEVLYLLESQIQLKQENYELANISIDQALDINPQYARAYLARGNVYYLLATKSNFDAKLLDSALDQYMLAYSMPNQPEGAYIPIKAHTAIGGVLVIRAQQTNSADAFAQAIENYKYVVDEYNRSNDPRLRSYASIAYFGLGAAYERQDKLTEAIQAYQYAYTLAEDEDFKVRIQLQIEIVQQK